MSIAQRDELSN